MAITPLAGSAEFFKSLRSINSAEESSNKTINRLGAGGNVTERSITAKTIIDQTFRSKLGVSSTLTQNLGNSRGAVAVAQLGVKNLSELTTSIQEKLISLANSSNSDSEVKSITKDLKNLLKQAQQFVASSEFNSVNLLSASAKDLSVVATEAGDKVTVTSQSSVGAAVTSLEQAIQNGVRIGDPNSILQSEFKSFQTALSDATVSLGASDRAISFRQQGLQDFNETLLKNLGNLVESDIERDVIRNTALSVQTQLSRQALSISNGNPSSIIKLFK
ncbi:MAG: flagellin [Pseudomonadota bacterium]|nr:flagellin [Pseudomonadota bacterium]